MDVADKKKPDGGVGLKNYHQRRMEEYLTG